MYTGARENDFTIRALGAAGRGPRRAQRAAADPGRVRQLHRPGEKEAAVSAQKLGQLQPFVDVLPPECMGQLAFFGPT